MPAHYFSCFLPGCSTVAYVSSTTRAGTGCGRCHDEIKGLIEINFQAAVA